MAFGKIKSNKFFKKFVKDSNGYDNTDDIEEIDHSNLDYIKGMDDISNKNVEGIDNSVFEYMDEISGHNTDNIQNSTIGNLDNLHEDNSDYASKKKILKLMKAKRKPKKDKDNKKNLTPKEQIKKITRIIILSSITVTVIVAVLSILKITKYDPSSSGLANTSGLDTVKEFITTESIADYEELIERHSNQEKNQKLDIKNITASIDREYPFSIILNKTLNNTSTKLVKFIYTELKPAIISYKMMNDVLPYEEGEGVVSGKIDLAKINDFINFKDGTLEGFAYYVKENMNSKYSFSVEDSNGTIPIILFDITELNIKEIKENEVNLTQGKYSLILKTMEEYNNIRVKSINAEEKSCIIEDTITNKVVKLSIS